MSTANRQPQNIMPMPTQPGDKIITNISYTGVVLTLAVYR